MDFKKKKREEIFPSIFPFPTPPTVTSIIPPTNQNELTGLVIDLLLSNPLILPTDSFTLLRNIKKNYRSVEYSTFVFKTLNINETIRELISNNLITCEEISINLKRAYYIKSVDMEQLSKYRITLPDSKINPDYDKYYEKAKNIAINCIKNKIPENDKDNLFQNIYGSILVSMNNNSILNRYSLKKRNRANSVGKPFENQNNMNLSMSDHQMDDIENQEDQIENDEYINTLIYLPTAKAMLSCDHYTDAQDILSQGPKDYRTIFEKIKAKYGSSIRRFCEHGTRAECEKKNKGECHKVHFKPIIGPNTDVSLGDCSYLDTCRHMDICKYVHYQIEDNDTVPSNRKELVLSGDEFSLDSQWINCDIRKFDSTILGKFDVIMADPPWDIHMDLPYGTLSDEEMKNLPVKNLQDDGVIFLWVTGRATELARECLELWGYERKEELVWIKTNQLQRLIRTGRTGHWLNHSKEHCLIGYKGNPKLNKGVDCDVLVSEVRETSRKPDEIYELIERMKPGGRKLELFARSHNRRKGWVSLGNQLPGIYFVEEDMIERFNKAFPDMKVTKETMEENKAKSTLKKIA